VRKVRVRDDQGTRWTVRTRRLRSTETTDPISRPEQESLMRRLTRALAPHAAVAIDPMRGVPDRWPFPGDTSDIELREARAAHGDSTYGSSRGVWALLGFVKLVGDAVDHLRTPLTDTWQLEAAARGRIRRWVRWEVQGPENAERSAAAVAAALASGRVPHPDDAVLVEVVDQRPATASRRSAGLGGGRTAG
jgi:hypothetical protein